MAFKMRSVVRVNSLRRLVNFFETEQEPLISFDDVLEAVHKPVPLCPYKERVNGESPSPYVSAKICCIV
ncbi:MAG: hypothetical protein ACLR5T_06675 [Veillonella sp.]